MRGILHAIVIRGTRAMILIRALSFLRSQSKFSLESWSKSLFYLLFMSMQTLLHNEVNEFLA
jgi:hypothetical protein